MRPGAERLRAGMARRAPKGDPAPPNLSDEIIVANARNPEASDIATLAIGPSSGIRHYGFHQETGTARHRAQPFARPTVDAEGPAVVAEVAANLWRELIVAGATTARGSGGGIGDVVGSGGTSTTWTKGRR